MTRRLLAATALAGATVFACLSIRPVTVAPTDAGAGLQITGDADPACFACIEHEDEPGPGCATEFALCKADAKCARIFACALESNCLAAGSISAMVVCGYPCLADAGVLSLDDPTFPIAQGLFACVAQPCAAACHLTEDGGA
jgi:hypothetical protein